MNRLLAATLLIATPAASALADSRHMEATGSSLAIDSPCAVGVAITPDASLSGRMVLDATALHPEEMAQLVFDSGKSAKLHIAGSACWRPDGDRNFRETQTIALRVPAGMAIAIAEGGDARYTLGAIGGALTLDLSGVVKLKAERASTAAIELSGDSEVGIAQMDGDLKIDVSGSGSIDVSRAILPQLAMAMSGSARFALGGGQVGQLTLDLSGSGSVRIGAPVGNATLAISGSGNVSIAKVTGSITKAVDGSGTVTIGE